MTDKNITVIGLGSMGFGVACCLVKARFTTYGVDIRKDAIKAFNQNGGIGTTDGHIAVQNSSIVFVFLVSADDVQSVLLGDNGIARSAQPDTVFVLCSTMPAQRTIAIAHTLENMGMRVLDAPVSGGQVKANSGDLTVMASGADDVFADLDPILPAIAAKVFRLGNTIGIGSNMKMINQLLAGTHIAIMGEAFALARKVGLDISVVYDVITQSAGSSWVFENRGAHVRDADYTPRSAIDIFVKDLGIVHNEATTVDFTPAFATMAWHLFQQASENGWGQQDDAAVAKWIAEKNGFQLHDDGV